MMKTSHRNTESEQRIGPYALRRGLGTWEVTFDERRDSFRDEQGAEYVVRLLLHPPPPPIHGAALVLEAGHTDKYVPEGAEVFQQRSLGLDDAEGECGTGIAREPSQPTGNKEDIQVTR